MLELGWSEIFVIVALAILLVGPKELPVVMRAMGQVFRRLYYIKYAFSRQFEDFMRETDLDELRKSVNFEARKFDDAIAKGDFNEAEADEEYLKEDAPKKAPKKKTNKKTKKAEVKDAE